MSLKAAQIQPQTLAGSGSSIADTSLTLVTFNDIDGNPLVMADFGTVGYGTLEPGSQAQEEQMSFTGITANANGTVTLTGVKHVDFLTPYTETSGLQKSHAGGTRFVISNTSGFYNTFPNKLDDETIQGTWTFTNPNVPRMDVEPSYLAGSELQFATKEYVDSVATSGAPNASTTVKGIVQEATQAQNDARTTTGSTGARLFINPGTLRATQYHDYQGSVVGTDSYAITCTPAVTSLVAGDQFILRSDVANTGPATLAVNGLAAKAIKKYVTLPLDDNDLAIGSIVSLIYDGVNDCFQLQNPPAKQQLSQNQPEIYGATSTGTDAYAINPAPAITALVPGALFRFRADVPNANACTLNVSGLGPVAILKQSTVPLATGDILAGQIVEVAFDGTNFQMMSTIASTFSFASGVTSELVTSAAGNNDLTVTTGFTPRVIKLTYVLQGHDGAAESNNYYGFKGQALFQGSTFSTNYAIWGSNSSPGTSSLGSVLTGDNTSVQSNIGTLALALAQWDVGATIPTIGTTAANGGITVTITVDSVNSTGFILRRPTAIGTAPSTARVKCLWEAWG